MTRHLAVPRTSLPPLAALAFTALLAAPAAAQIPLGAVGPDFTKVQLGGGSVSLSQYSGKVVVLFLLGYS
jgi:hypothetical protein